MAMAELQVKVTVDTKEVELFISDIRELAACVDELRSIARTKTRMSIRTEHIADIVERVVHNMSKVELASR